jgi:hypothetical protein
MMRPIAMMIVMMVAAAITTMVAADYVDPYQCALQQYSGECCMPGALPLVLDITTCAPGFYCPFLANTTSTLITSCPPTPVCQLRRLSSGFCPPPQGKHEPLLCPVRG